MVEPYHQPRYAPDWDPAVSLKLSISQFNEDFKLEVQIYFIYCLIRGTRHFILHLVDSGTAFPEASIVPSRHMDVITARLELEWINPDGAPEFVSGEGEFDGTKNLIEHI